MPALERHIVVAGSVNLDMTLRLTRAPEAGETLRADSLAYAPGGKGANQAVAAARLGAPVRMVACVGDDAAGAAARRNLSDNGVDTTFVRSASGYPQGLAVILVEGSGENRIVIAEGSNGAFAASDVKTARAAFDGAAILLLQNEVSLDTTMAAAREARNAGARVVWNPAPAPAGMPAEMAGIVDILLVNESEAATLSGMRVESTDDAIRAAAALRDRGLAVVVVTLGDAGAMWLDADGVVRAPGLSARVADTTGAGDTFAGAMAVALFEGRSPSDTLQFANRAAAVSVTKPGAQGGMPLRADLGEA